MKKTLSLAFLAALCAIGTAFASKIVDVDPDWMLNDDTIVTGTAARIKTLYCPGANVIQCAVNMDGTGTIIRKN